MVFKVVSNTRYGTKRDFVKEITDNVPHHVQIDSLKSAYPNGRIVRNDFYLGSLEGEAGESLRITM